MRELYACQLDLALQDHGASVVTAAKEWVARGSGLTVAEMEQDGVRSVQSPRGHDLEFALGAGDDTSWTCSWRHQDDQDADLVWRILFASGNAAADTLRVTLRVRLERAGDGFRLAPLEHSFRSPAIVRTLLREHVMVDAGQRVEPSYRVRLAADVDDLAEFLLAKNRRLPVFVISRAPDGSRDVDAAELARQLAGLAHVEVLTTHLAALRLSDLVGRDKSVWGGAIRLYWPGMNLDESPTRHRLWTRNRLSQSDGFITWALAYLGSLGSATVPEHPVVADARASLRRPAGSEEVLPAWVEEVLSSMDTDRREAESESKELRRELNASREARLDLESQLEDVRRSFVVYSEHNEPGPQRDVDLENLDVAAAYRLARSEAPDSVVYLPAVDESIDGFSTYKSPRRLYEALTAIGEAATAWRDGGLGQGFGDFFTQRGYEYSKKNPAAVDRRTKRHYRIQYENDTVSMTPHLKVDQATSPDQCLRIYWFLDEENKRIVIGHAGRHLPD